MHSKVLRGWVWTFVLRWHNVTYNSGSCSYVMVAEELETGTQESVLADHLPARASSGVGRDPLSHMC